MTTRTELLNKLSALLVADPENSPVVTLDEFFLANEDEESIAPNNWGYGRPSIKEIYRSLKEIEHRPDVQGSLLVCTMNGPKPLRMMSYGPQPRTFISSPVRLRSKWKPGLQESRQMGSVLAGPMANINFPLCLKMAILSIPCIGTSGFLYHL